MTTPVTAVGRVSGGRLAHVQGPVMPDWFARELDRSGSPIPEEWLQCGYHYCPDWDEMLIGPAMPAFDACTCPAFKQFRPVFIPAQPVTAVGRLLQPKHGEPRILHRIKRDPASGKVRTITRRILKPQAKG